MGGGGVDLNPLPIKKEKKKGHRANLSLYVYCGSKTPHIVRLADTTDTWQYIWIAPPQKRKEKKKLQPHFI